MISEEFQEIVLTVKEMLSSDSGFYQESMAPLIGYPKAFHGTLFPVGLKIIPCKLQSTNGLGKTLMDTLDIYKEVSVLVNEDGDTFKVYANESLLNEEMYRILNHGVPDFTNGECRNYEQSRSRRHGKGCAGECDVGRQFVVRGLSADEKFASADVLSGWFYPVHSLEIMHGAGEPTLDNDPEYQEAMKEEQEFDRLVNTLYGHCEAYMRGEVTESVLGSKIRKAFSE